MTGNAESIWLEVEQARLERTDKWSAKEDDKRLDEFAKVVEECIGDGNTNDRELLAKHFKAVQELLKRARAGQVLKVRVKGDKSDENERAWFTAEVPSLDQVYSAILEGLDKKRPVLAELVSGSDGMLYCRAFRFLTIQQART